MPTYSYRCSECDNAFDIQQAFTDSSLTVCPVCGGKLRKVFGVVGVTFNGPGFYRTDSRSTDSKHGTKHHAKLDASKPESGQVRVDHIRPSKSGFREGTRRGIRVVQFLVVLQFVQHKQVRNHHEIRERTMIKGFKEFILRGNVIDLAVAFVIGVAFAAVVTAFVEKIINPLIGALFSADSLNKSLILHVGSANLQFGALIGAIIQFLLIALVVYFALVVPMNYLRKLSFRRARHRSRRRTRRRRSWSCSPRSATCWPRRPVATPELQARGRRLSPALQLCSPSAGRRARSRTFGLEGARIGIAGIRSAKTP